MAKVRKIPVFYTYTYFIPKDLSHPLTAQDLFLGPGPCTEQTTAQNSPLLLSFSLWNTPKWQNGQRYDSHQRNNSLLVKSGHSSNLSQFEGKYIKQANRGCLDKIISEDFNTNPKKFWSYIKSKHKESTGVSPLKNQDGFLKSDGSSKAEILNTQFKSVFTEEDLSNLPHKGESPYPNMDNIEVREKGVFKLL